MFLRTNFSMSPDSTWQKLVKAGISLAKVAMTNEYNTKSKNEINLATRYNVSTDNYEKNNRQYIEDLYKYCLQTSPLHDRNLDPTNKEDVVRMFHDASFRDKFFAIQIDILNTINSDNEVQEALMFANVKNVALGDSLSENIGSKALLKVQDHSWGNNVSVAQQQFSSPIHITPRPKSAKVAIDIDQASALDYDFGKQIAKIAVSFRAKMYNEIIDILYTTANVSSTPFYKAAFAKATFTEVVEQLKATNNAGVRVYGTRLALVNMSDGITNGFNTQDEINKTGFIGNLYGVPTNVIDQAVDSNSSSYTTRVPNDRIVLLSDVGDKPVKMAKENMTRVIVENGQNQSQYRESYLYIDSWQVKLATQAHYGIIVI